MSEETPRDRAAIKARAWETRRKRYGEKGHRGLDKGAYRRRPHALEAPDEPAPQTERLEIAGLVIPAAPLVTIAWTGPNRRKVMIERPALVFEGRYTFAGEPPFEFLPADLIVAGRYVDRLTVWRNPARYEVQVGETPVKAQADAACGAASAADRMHEMLQVGDGLEAVQIAAWEVARDLQDCPRCGAEVGLACHDERDEPISGEVHVERLARELARGRAGDAGSDTP